MRSFVLWRSLSMISMWRVFILLYLTFIDPVGAFPLRNEERTVVAARVSGSRGGESRPTEQHHGIATTHFRRSDSRDALATSAERCSSDKTPAQRRHASFERWSQLPESWASNHNNNRKRKRKTNHIQPSPRHAPSSSLKDVYQKTLHTLHVDHPMRLGVTQKQRTTELIHAAEVGNATRLELLLRAGANVDALDLYGTSSLCYAASHGHLAAATALLRWGATVHGCSPQRVAFANGHAAVYALLNNDRHSNATTVDSGLPPTTHFDDAAVRLQHECYGREGAATGARSAGIQTTTVLSLDKADHEDVGSGSFYVDHAFCTEFIDKIVAVDKSGHRERRDEDRTRRRPTSTHAKRRNHYCDTEGWLYKAVEQALRQARPQAKQTAQQPSAQPGPRPVHHVFPHVRVISYRGEEPAASFLAPHRDFPALDRATGRTSTHTLILYLATVPVGGETVLLEPAALAKSRSGGRESALGAGSIRCAVKPVKGRLFVFPHGCPHAGLPVMEGAKLILRGDVCVERQFGVE